MNGVASYLLTVTAAALLAAVLLTIAGQGQMSGLTKLLAGVFMAVTVISPLLELELPDPESWFADFSADGQLAAAQGEELANETEQAIIKSRLESYILDKAAGYGAALTADVALDEAGVPVSVTVSGEVSPYVRMRLTQMIRSDLGIGEEAQQWSG